MQGTDAFFCSSWDGTRASAPLGQIDLRDGELANDLLGGETVVVRDGRSSSLMILRRN
jgi:hypothetical protein